MSSRTPIKVTFSLGEFRRHGGDTGAHIDGWGLACFDGFKAEVYREPEAAALSRKMGKLMKEHQPSNLVISHIRKATQGGISLDNTQPFVMLEKNHHHVFAHNGNLINIQNEVVLNTLQPKGETDSEYAFCYLMEKMQLLWNNDTPTLQQRIEVIKETFDELSKLGPANFIYCDGEYLFTYANKRIQANGKMEPPGLYYLVRSPSTGFSIAEIPGIKISDPEQQMVLVASVPLTKENWQPFKEKELIVVQSGELLYSSE